MNNKIILILVIIFILLVIGFIYWHYFKQTEVVISGARGDFVYEPVETECIQALQNYVQNSDKFSQCRLVESKIGGLEKENICDLNECPNGCSVAGCYICKLECR